MGHFRSIVGQPGQRAMAKQPPFLSVERTGTGNSHSLTTWSSLALVKYSSEYVQFHL